MGIRALCAAAAVMVGVGSAAEAATIEQYDYRLRYEGTTFGSVAYSEYETQTRTEYGTVHSSADPFGLPHRFSDLAVGDYVNLHIRAEIPHNPIYDSEGNGGRAPVCLIGSFNCSAFVKGAEPGLNLYNIWNLFLIMKDGDTIFQTEGGYAGDYYKLEFGEVYYRDPTAEFSIIAPIPLPATVALLPLGMGALALMRRRRRSA
ncbi:hypothetical protein PARHAE_01120 [Paracoccus haematequi]|uniref:VPLPA-CTERM protein sorting domain-containing protein n=1 Tax=Paracoccus haematequi TaxID=2491866 RepID=A0A3S4DV13_9RHOB|nr:hypothetical protein [Paracoccus haematequi]VDS07940.1 hypothetical protein PARHAE_01120 [Paracoccus haematequi]